MSFSFGTPSSAPATSATSGGFSFGANKPAAPSFGLNTSQPSTGLFGSPATAAPTFGAAAPAFGAAAPAFGAANTSFGATPAFGVATTSAAPAFGATAAPAFGAASAAPLFGATSAAPAFGATSAAPAFGGLNFGAASTAAASLSFGAPAATTSAGLGGFGFGTTTTASQPGFGLASTGLFAGTGPKLGTALGTQPSTTTVAPSLGLGGISSTATGVGAANTSSADGKNEPPKQTKLPTEISSTIDSFKEFMKKQKSLSSDIMRVSNKPMHKVSYEVEELCSQVVSLGGEVCRGRAAARRLRAAAAAAAQAADAAMSQPPGCQLEGSAPPQFVKELLAELEQQLVTFRRQMDVADKQLQAAPRLLTEQELTLGIRRMHSSLVALAARLQAAHAQVAAQKEQYLNLRRYVLKDPSDVFEASAQSGLDQILREAEGHRKKTKVLSHDASRASAVVADPRAALGNITALAGPTPFTYFGSTLSPYPTAETTAPSWQPPAAGPPAALAPPAYEASSFQLQKPPGKRGKP